MRTRNGNADLSLLFGAFVLCAGGAAIAQTPPDAGRILDTTREPPKAVPRAVPSVEVQTEVRPALAGSSVKVAVASFRITGNSAFSEGELQPILQPFVGKELDLAGLDQAAGAISDFYRERGYFVARAYLPAQEIAGGVVEIAVIEGRLGNITVKRSGATRLSEERAKEIVAASAVPGTPISERNVERGLMLLSDTPGVEVKSTLVPGATPGTSDLVVEAVEGGLFAGNLDVDNYGNRFTGAARLGGTFNLNDPSGRGDLLSARVQTSGSGMDYGRFSYIYPLASSGTRLGFAYSAMEYKLGKEFSVLNAKGSANVASAFLVHPFVRSRNTNVYGTLGFDTKQLEDKQMNFTMQDKRVNVANVGLTGDSRDGLGGGGMFTWGLTFAGGELDLGGVAGAKALDAATAKSNGSYSKINYSIARLQRLQDRWSLYASFSGQNASKNLDSSEKFVLGGLGVRAYAVSEAPADEGYVINLEARYDVPGISYGNLQLVGFFDTGGVRLHRQTWAGWQPVGLPNYPNTYRLSGAGFGLIFYKTVDFSVRANYAWKVGSNPGRDASNKDSDNTSDSGRFWLQAIKWF